MKTIKKLIIKLVCLPLIYGVYLVSTVSVSTWPHSQISSLGKKACSNKNNYAYKTYMISVVSQRVCQLLIGLSCKCYPLVFPNIPIFQKQTSAERANSYKPFKENVVSQCVLSFPMGQLKSRHLEAWSSQLCYNKCAPGYIHKYQSKADMANSDRPILINKLSMACA